MADEKMIVDAEAPAKKGAAEKVAADAFPEHVEAAVTVRYMIPGTMPPRFGAYAKGAVFASSELPEADVRAMLRQKTLLPYVEKQDAGRVQS